MEARRQGFIFDLDGTLADTMPAHYLAWIGVAERYGLTFPEDRFYQLGGVPTAKIAELLINEAALGLDPLVVAKDKERAYVAGLADASNLQPIQAVIEIARRRRGEGPLAIASGSLRHLVDRTLSQLGIAEWFTAIVSAEDTARHKPEPDVFLEAARRLGLPPTACTVYEDTDIGLEAARRAGMQSVDVRTLYTPRRITTAG
jgi:beta-phosphoglucomutase-like phosphatase (HAD superfamily)